MSKVRIDYKAPSKEMFDWVSMFVAYVKNVENVGVERGAVVFYELKTEQANISGSGVCGHAKTFSVSEITRAISESMSYVETYFNNRYGEVKELKLRIHFETPEGWWRNAYIHF